jgi:hypothetical protein
LERHPEALALSALALLRDALLDPILAPDNNNAGGGLVRPSNALINSCCFRLISTAPPIIQPRAQRAARLGPHLGTLLVSLYAALARLPGLRRAFAASSSSGALTTWAGASSSSMSVKDERKVAMAVVDILRRYVCFFIFESPIQSAFPQIYLPNPASNSLVVDERVLLKPWLTGLDPFPPLAPDAALTAGGVLRPEELQRLEDARQALVRASSVEGSNDDHDDDDETAHAVRVLLEQARRCAATLSRGGSEGGMAGQVAKLVALQALVTRLSPLPGPAGGRTSAASASSSSDAAATLRLAGQGGTGRELRRVLVPPLLELCRGGGEAGIAVQLEAARALGALGAVPPWELMLWDPYDPTAVGEDGSGGGVGAVGGGGGAGHGGTQGRTRGRSNGQDAQQQQASAPLPPIQVQQGISIHSF